VAFLGLRPEPWRAAAKRRGGGGGLSKASDNSIFSAAEYRPLGAPASGAPTMGLGNRITTAILCVERRTSPAGATCGTRSPLPSAQVLIMPLCRRRDTVHRQNLTLPSPHVQVGAATTLQDHRDSVPNGQPAPGRAGRLSSPLLAWDGWKGLVLVSQPSCMKFWAVYWSSVLSLPTRGWPSNTLTPPAGFERQLGSPRKTQVPRGTCPVTVPACASRSPPQLARSGSFLRQPGRRAAVP
jgi:hypothetical protein